MQSSALIQELVTSDSVRFGNFTLRSGQSSSVYIDLRAAITLPHILQSMGQLLWQKIYSLPCDLICGVPYTAWPLATCVSLVSQKPMLLCRKEVKSHGTKKLIEGTFKTGQTCVVIEDVMTTGGSVLECIQSLEQEGLIVRDVVTLLDREQGARENLAQHNYKLHSVLTLGEVLKFQKASLS